MRCAIFTVVIIAAGFLLPNSTVFAQNVTSLNCPPTATAAGEEGAIRSATKEYLTSLRGKDWNAASKLSVSFLTGFNLSLSLMRDLFQPLEIESLGFEIHEVSVKPCEASVRYTLSVRAIDPQTHKRVIDIANGGRIAHWRRFECECPPRNLTTWMLVRDVAGVPDLRNALAAAKTREEQRLLLLAQDEKELKEVAAVLARQGYELLKQEREADASKMFSLNRAVLGQLRYQSGIWNLQQAKGLEGMLAEAEGKNDMSARASILNSLGQVYVNLGEQEKALKFFAESLKFPDAGGGEVAASAYNNIATIYRNRGAYARSVEYFLKSLERYKTALGGSAPISDSVKEDLIEVLFNLAFLYEALGREDLAQNSYRELLSRVEKGGDVEALSLLLVGAVKTVKGNVAEAIEYLERASSILERSTSEDKAPFNVITSSLLVEPYLRRNDYAHAATHLVRAREALKGAKEGEISEGFIRLIESMLYGSQGDKQLAASRTRQGFGSATREVLGNTDKVSSDVSVSHEDDSDIAFLPNLLALQAVGNILGGVLEDAGGNEAFNVPVVLNAAALEHLLRGGEKDLETARKWLFRVLAEAEGDELLIAQTHERIARIYFRQKNYPEALNHYQKSLDLIEHARLPLTLRLTESDPMLISIWRNIARTHAALGDYEQSLASYRKILDRGGRFYRLLDTTMLYEVAEINFKTGKYEAALSSISRAFSAAMGGGDRDVLWKLHTLAGKCQRALKRDTAAASSFAEAIREVEASRSGVVGGNRIKERFFEDKLGPYHEMIEMLVEQSKCGEALAYAERSKSRVLMDALNRRSMSVSQTLTAAEREEGQTLRSRMIAADREFDSALHEQPDSPRLLQLREKRLEARLEYEAFRTRLRLPSAGTNAPPSPPMDVIGSDEIAALLPPTGGALLEFSVTDNKTYLFVLTEGEGKAGKGVSQPLTQCTVHSININAKELNERVATFNRRIANSQGVVQPLARALYELLLKPARAELSGRASLVLVPDRYLWTLPYQALQSSDGRYLLQESAVSYAPSLTSLREMRKKQNVTRPRRAAGVSAGMPTRRSSENPTLLVMANPAGDLSPLLATEVQAPRIAQLYGTGRSKVYIRADADERRFKREAQSFDVIHLGAHGLLDDDDPMYSRILLARGEKRVGRTSSTPLSTIPSDAAAEDGLLEAWEIMDLELKANLVVLSACETARGRVGDGEGVVGLTWALFMAGVPSTVVSQWKVDEGATNELMYLFHENLMKSGSPDLAHPRKAEALRQASQKLIRSEQYSHPYYWAGFVLIGDGN